MNADTVPETRNNAKKGNFLYYFTGKPCKNGHVEKRQTSNGTCVKCNRNTALKYYGLNSDQRKKDVKKYQLKNKDKTRTWQQQSYLNNRPAYIARAVKRVILSKKQTPKWLNESDRNKIVEFYKDRDRLTKLTGIEMHVDHMVPLQGKLVSGLNVPWNLQILTAFDNISKSNKLLPEFI